MRIRIKFTRNDFVKYLGHLDIMRTFQRCFNRAGVKMNYSEGFNPHQKMSFALPLAVGVLSRGEYLDAEVAEGQDPETIRRDLDIACGLGFDILDVRIVEEGAQKAMAAVKYASYDIVFDQEYELYPERYLNRETIILQKKTKTGSRDVDIAQIIKEMNLKGRVLHILMESGGENSIKPELIAADLMEYHGLPFHRDCIEVTRNDLYAQGVIPLIEYQTYQI